MFTISITMLVTVYVVSLFFCYLHMTYGKIDDKTFFEDLAEKHPTYNPNITLVILCACPVLNTLYMIGMLIATTVDLIVHAWYLFYVHVVMWRVKRKIAKIFKKHGVKSPF